MADQLYAWSNIRYDVERGKDNQVIKRKVLQYGEKADKAKMGLDDEGFQALIDAGAVRAIKPPEIPEGSTDSPMQTVMNQLNATTGSLSGSNLAPEVMDQLAAMQPPEPEAKPAAS